MKRLDVRVFGGVLLVAGGLLLLLQNIGVLRGDLRLLWGILFVAAAILFFSLFLGNREQWWVAIPAFTFLGLTGSLVLPALLPRFGEDLGGAFFLCMLSLAFWTIYLIAREKWWVILPAGVLLTLALIELLSLFMAEDILGALFFVGLGATFALLALLPTPTGRMKWAIAPAGGLLLIGLVIAAASTQVLNYLWPIALILGGIYLIAQIFRKRGDDEHGA